VPSDSPESYRNVAARLAREIPGACNPDQYSNPANPRSHYRTTGPEIWDDTDGKVAAFVAGVGTAGTIIGTARYLKERNPKIQIIGADPAGSIYSHDEIRPYKVEGIGQDAYPANWDESVVDRVIRVDDRTSFQLARRLAQNVSQRTSLLCFCQTPVAAIFRSNTTRHGCARMASSKRQHSRPLPMSWHSAVSQSQRFRR
jgi:cystathionine beta-synthase